MAHSSENDPALIREIWGESLREVIESRSLTSLDSTVPYRAPKRTRRQKIALKLHFLRERVALKIAPWLDDGEWY